MSDKYVILMNKAENGVRPTQVNLGKKSDAEQEQFFKLIHDLVRNTFPCWTNRTCSFSVFAPSNYTGMYFVCPKTVGWVLNPNSTKKYQASKQEIVIEIKPGIQDAKPDKYCDCGASSANECPIYIQNGKCKSILIQKYIGSVFLSKEYKL